MAQDKLIKQHNAITTARYNMSAMQKNLFYMLLAQLKENEPTAIQYQINIKELEQLRGVTIRSDEIFQAANAMVACTFTFYDPHQDRFISLEPIARTQYVKGTKRLHLEIDAKMLPLLFNFKGNYTAYQLKKAVALNSKYSKRIYEMLAQFKDTGWLTVTLQELKERLELIDPQTGMEKFSRYALFKKYVLEVAQKELSRRTDVNFTYQAYKRERKYTKLLFKIDKNLADKPKALIKEGKYPNLQLEQEALSQYRLITEELRWLNKKLAYALVVNIPTQAIWNHIDKVKMSIQSGKRVNPTTYFKEILKQYTQKETDKLEIKESLEAKPVAIIKRVSSSNSMLPSKPKTDTPQKQSANLEEQAEPVNTRENPNYEKKASRQDKKSQLLEKLMFEFKVCAIHALAAVDRVPDQKLKQAIDELGQAPDRAKLIISELISSYPDKSPGNHNI